MRLMTRFLLAFLLFKSIDATSQVETRKRIHCKIVADANTSVEGVNILNILSEQTAVSDEKGEFYILAKYDDLLLITAVNIEIKRKLIEDEDLALNSIEIKVIAKTTALNEVVVNNFSEINAVSLGIIPKAIHQPTRAERGVYVPRKSFGESLKVLITGYDPVLEKTILTEKKIRLMPRIEYLFEQDYYTETLKIPKDYIRGFYYFCLEDDAFRTALEEKRKSMRRFLILSLIVPLAEKFNENLACEEQF